MYPPVVPGQGGILNADVVSNVRGVVDDEAHSHNEIDGGDCVDLQPQQPEQPQQIQVCAFSYANAREIRLV